MPLLTVLRPLPYHDESIFILMQGKLELLEAISLASDDDLESENTSSSASDLELRPRDGYRACLDG